MPKVKDILGNERIIADETITISIDRFSELIVKEAKYDSGEHNSRPNIAMCRCVQYQIILIELM